MSGPLPGVVIVATGGTIAGESESGGGDGSSYTSGTLPVTSLLQAVPQMAALADVRAEQFASIGSQDMDDALWVALARRLRALMEQPDVHGLVVTHGTDTLEETAYFLHLVLPSHKPLVLTGAIRPADALSADGPLNLFNAVAVAAHAGAAGRGALVVANDVIHGAREVTKTQTLSVQAFESMLGGPIGALHYGRMQFFRAAEHRRLLDDAALRALTAPLPRVEIVYAHANMCGELIDLTVQAGACGLVLAGVGDGNASQAALAALARAAAAGIPVVRSTRADGGAVLRNAEVDDDALGFVAAGVLNPQKARILLALALRSTKDPRAIQALFDTY